MTAILKQMCIALILMIGVTMAMSTTVQTQPKSISVEEQINILKKKLKLNAAQTSKITVIIEDQREEMITTKNELRGDQEALRSALQAIMRKTNNQIKAVLTEEQKVKYDELLKERRDKMEQHMQQNDNQ